MSLNPMPIGDYIHSNKNLNTQNCLLCSNSFSEELGDGANQLRCAIHEWKVAEDNGVCGDFQ